MMFDRIAATALKSPIAVVAGILAVVIAVAAIALPPALEGDLMRLLPDDNPAVKALTAHRRQPGGEDAVALTLPADADIEAVAARVEKLESVRATFYGLTGDLGLKLAVLQLKPEQIEKLADDVHASIAFRNPALIKKPEIEDGLFSWMADPLAELGQAGDEDDKVQILIVIPMLPPTDPEFALGLLEDLERSVPEATFIAGPHADIGTAIRDIQRDFVQTSVVSLLLVATFVALAFRSIGGLLILVPPLILANVLATSAVSLIFGSLNLYTSMGGAIVFGLGIDFGIHLVARFREELGNGLTESEAVRAAWSTTGPPCLTAALTSAAGFLVFLFAEFEGMRQLGVLLAFGVILSLGMMLLILPVVLTRIPLPHRIIDRQAAAGTRTWPWTLAAVILLCALLLPSAPDLQFEYDISATKREGLAWDELTADEQSYRQNAFPPVYIATDDRSALHAELAARVERGDFKHVRGVISLDSVLPPDQELRLAALEKLIKSANHPRRMYLRPSLRDALQRIGSLDTSIVRVEDLPEGMARLIGARGENVLLLLEGNMLDLRVAAALTEELDDYKETAANGFFVMAALGNIISADLPRVAGLALLIVFLIILFDLRKPALIAIAAGGLLLGLVWAAATMALFGVRINIVNVVALPMLLGIGIDIIVHLLHRLRSGTPVGETLRTTGVAVLFSTMTTIAAFVSLTVANDRGLQSIGLVILIGLTAVLVAAVLIITTAWPLYSKSGRN